MDIAMHVSTLPLGSPMPAVDLLKHRHPRPCLIVRVDTVNSVFEMTAEGGTFYFFLPYIAIFIRVAPALSARSLG
jgi:hypothetical protein